MTIKGQEITPIRIRLIIARLMQSHHETHPKRIAQLFGLSPAYCKRIWRETPFNEMPHSQYALTQFAQLRETKADIRNHELENMFQEVANG